MPTILEIQINVARAYIARIKEVQTTPVDESKQLLGILDIYLWQLIRRKRGMSAGLDELPTLNHGVRQAELFLQDVIGDNPRYVMHDFAVLTRELILEFTKEIVETEKRFPELTREFVAERAFYRKMKDDAEEQGF